MTELPDSGLRSAFAVGGAQREADPDKPAMEFISPYLNTRLGIHMGKADRKYEGVGGARNWEKGMPVMRYIAGILRHVGLYVLRRKDEDHLAGIVWGGMCLIHHEEVGGAVVDGVRLATWDELDDRPRWAVSEHDENAVTTVIKEFASREDILRACRALADEARRR